ncbi:MAG: MFS transporter [Proteobacteria bacterium]|nr:MFS transporter [Pseudomonadota bacterium]
MKRPPLPVFYISTALSLVVLGDALIYTILPSYYQHLGLLPFQVGILLSVNRWIRLATNHLAEHCYRRYPSNLWLIFALLMGSVVTAMYGLAHLFIIFLGARILWGLSYSFIRQAGIMTAVKSGSPVHLGERIGYYRGINAMWRTLGVFIGSLCHDVFGFDSTLITLSFLSLVAMPLGALSQKGLRRLQVPVEKDLSGKGNAGVICCGFAVGLVGAGMIMSTLGLILKEHVGDAVALAGYSLGVVTLTGIILGFRFFLDGIGNPILGSIADRTGRERSITFLFSVGAMSLFISAMNLKPIMLVIFVLTFFACGTTLWTLLSSQAGQRGTRSVASFATAMDLGASVGPLMSWSIAHFEFPTNCIFLSAGTIFMIGAVISSKTFGTKIAT